MTTDVTQTAPSLDDWMMTDLGLCRKKLADVEAEIERCRKTIAAIRQWRHPALVEVSPRSAQIIESGDINALHARIAELEGWIEDQEDEIEWRRRWMKTTRSELKNHQQKVVAAVHQGIVGATRAWQEKVDEAVLLRDVAIIERDGALAETAHLRSMYTHQHGIAQEEHARADAAYAQLTANNIILSALAEAERLEDIALASEDTPGARHNWVAWRAQRAIASDLLRSWQKHNSQSA